MNDEIIKYGSLDTELEFLFVRASGPGGQNVNKVNSKAVLRFDVLNSQILSEEQKNTILKKLKSRINNDGILFLSSQEDRSQLKNKENVITRFYELINKSLKKHKKRVKTKPSKASIENRLKGKRETSEKKERRKSDFK
ncbi:MAG: alternative ribosome rescue aminoacyl-tRNA hydrolase ArfB [Bacteroidales bacterium]|nr:alternative ribosome rescue aminoacyl-tRNA hydrolase ArfB [Bacteroidales bacterium]MDD4218034.1 alternative ribosome rescue aminoacyl-tRNA hydrolase ArfB [Bacteroidales bacterium]MDY0142750.1 alternative ribosome rescue aminoacyl-tRNA hydrolase ArfB [Bacteroidales bacterium]